MYLYHSTIQAPTSIHVSVVGSFTGPGRSELVLSRGSSWLEVLRLNPSTGKLTSLWHQNVFCIIRSLTTFRLPGERRDRLVLGTDSGRLIILRASISGEKFEDEELEQYGDELGPGMGSSNLQWEQEHRETFGRSGVRRTVAGQYVVSDPRGRALMLAAIEKQKLVWQLTRATSPNSAAESTFSKTIISSPLEANRSNTIVFGLAGVDSGLDNPLFAALEVDTAPAIEDSEVTQPNDLIKQLVYYEVDVGINHITKKGTHPLSRTANWIMALPLADEGKPALDGPGGVLIGAEGSLTWHRLGSKAITCQLPCRYDPLSKVPHRPTIIINGCFLPSRDQGLFILIQNEEGDLFRVNLTIEGINVAYYDTVPVASSLQFFPTGFLWVASEHTDHRLYQVGSLGEISCSSSTNATFTRRFSSPVNLTLVDRWDSLAGCAAAQIIPLEQASLSASFLLCCAQGQGQHSQLRLLRPGLPITKVATTPLPTPPSRVWTLRSLRSIQDLCNNTEEGIEDYDAFIVISMEQSTIILRVGEVVEEATPEDTNLWLDRATLALGQLFDGSYVQVHTGGVRQVRPNGRIGEWKCPSGTDVTIATLNSKQVVLALNNHRLVHLEADQSGYLLETGQSAPLNFGIKCLALGPVPPTRLRCRYLAVGGEDLTVRIVTCDPDELLEPLAVQAVAALPTSLTLTLDPLERIEGINYGTEGGGGGDLLLHVGLENGVYCRLRVDGKTGLMKDAHTRYLGSPTPVTCCAINFTAAEYSTELSKLSGSLGRRLASHSEFFLMALSEQAWVNFIAHQRVNFCPVTTFGSPWVWISPFVSAQCPTGGFVAISRDSLQVFMIESTSSSWRFAGPTLPLSYTPRRIAYEASRDLMAIAESDHRGYTMEQRAILEREARDGLVDDTIMDGEWKSFNGKWSSCIRLIRPISSTPLSLQHLSQNETVTCFTFITFHDHQNELYLAVGVAKDMKTMPRSAAAAAILLFHINTASSQSNEPAMSLMHSTMVSDIPSACCALGGRLLCSVGSSLRLYDLGKKQLLRKCEVKIPSFATTLATQGWRIFMGDNHYSVGIYQYLAGENRFILVADDIVPRPITAVLPLDYETVAVGDRTGCFSILRLPALAAQEVEQQSIGLAGSAGTATNATISSTTGKRQHLFGASYRLDRLAEFYLGETIVSLAKTSGGLGCREVILYVTLSGAIGFFLPFTQRSEALLIQNLEGGMRKVDGGPATLLGRNVLLFRSYYAALKSVIDGDLCERFGELPGATANTISQQLDRLPNQIVSTLEELRITAGF